MLVTIINVLNHHYIYHLGITPSALWERLRTCEPAFPLALDDGSKEYIWKLVAQEDGIDFYLLSAPRLPLVIYDRYLNSAPDTGLPLEPVCDYYICQL